MKHERKASSICKSCGKLESEAPQWVEDCTGKPERKTEVIVSNDPHGNMFSHPYLRKDAAASVE